MRARGRVRASPQARQLADEMLAMDAVMAEILDETIPHPDDGDVTVHESGRTLCGSSDIHGPLARFPTAVELAECPRGVRGGTWHTHVTEDQLRKPSNSLPDTANVVFGEIDVSIVVGTQSAESVVAARDPKLAAQEFRDALGIDVESTDDVIDAIIGRDLSDPTDARRRVRQRMGSMFDRRRVNFRDLDARLQQSGVPSHSVANFEMIEAQRYASIAEAITQTGHRKNPVRDPAGVRRHVRATNHNVKEAAKNMRLHEFAARSAVGEVVGRAIRSVLR